MIDHKVGNTPKQVTIIGGGIMGLSIAFKIAHQITHRIKDQKSSSWLQVTVIDQGNFRESASSQAAGILATHGAQHFMSPLRRQIIESIRSYPDFLNKLEDVLGGNVTRRVGYRPLDHYHLYGTSLEDKEVLEKRIRRLTKEHSTEGKSELPPPSLISMFEGSDSFPNSEITSLKFQSHTLEPTNLLAILREAGKALGVVYLTGKVTGIHRQKDRIHLEYQNSEGHHHFFSDKLVLATGSETEETLSRIASSDGEDTTDLPYRLKTLGGYILVTEPFLNPVMGKAQKEILYTFSNKLYLLHKSDRALFGSFDYRDSDLSTNPNHPSNMEATLKNDLTRFFPSLAKNSPKILEILHGKRLYYFDKHPLLGYWNRNQNIFIASALYKSGLALAPLYSDLATKMLLQDNPESDDNLIRETEYISPLRKKPQRVGKPNPKP